MENKTRYERLCENRHLYPETFVSKMGHESVHWETDSWFQREAALRHDMVCLLLCNLEPMSTISDPKIEDVLEPPHKRPRLDELGTEGSASTSSSSGSYRRDFAESDFLNLGDDEKYRYILLEGRSNVVQIQNKLCEKYGLQKLTRQYDIFDRLERKFCEIKVTMSKDRSVEEYRSYMDSRDHTCFYHIHPERHNTFMVGKRDEFPGRGKAISFLVLRLTFMRTLGLQDSDIETETNLIAEVFKNHRFNQSMMEWVDSFWKLRDLPLLETDKDPTVPNPVTEIKERELKMLIEDTTKRNADFIKFKGKLLPEPFTSYVLTTKETDAEIINDLIGDTNFQDATLNWVIGRWRMKQDTFSFLTGKELKECPAELLAKLGIGQRKTTRSDNHETLVQEEFNDPPRLRYSAWISNLLFDCTKDDNDGLSYFTELTTEEMKTDHPISKAAQEIVNGLFTRFSHTDLASYCSKNKNFYSRIGGSYLKRGGLSDKRAAVVIFPLYASGQKDGESVRKVTGFVLRGPQHAKQNTDRIPIVLYELLGNKEKSLKYQKYIKGGEISIDGRGRKWLCRVNSIMKNDATYLTFIIDSIYLTANMLGEMAFQNMGGRRTDLIAEAEDLMSRCGQWFLERMAESVFMAVLGNSQEEGALAGLRKVFMLKLNWVRGEKAFGSDISGFAESINECLFDQPLALYFVKQFRDCLSEED